MSMQISPNLKQFQNRKHFRPQESWIGAPHAGLNTASRSHISKFSELHSPWEDALSAFEMRMWTRPFPRFGITAGYPCPERFPSQLFVIPGFLSAFSDL